MGFAEWLNEFLYVDQRQEIKAAEDQRTWLIKWVQNYLRKVDQKFCSISGINKKTFYGRMSCS